MSVTLRDGSSRRFTTPGAAFLVTLVLAAAGGWWVVAQAQSGGPTDPEATYAEVRRLRVEAHDYAAARALADAFLAGYATVDDVRGRIAFERGMTYFDEVAWANALTALAAVVADFSAGDGSALSVAVDDAQYHAALAAERSGDAAQAVTRFQALLTNFPESEFANPAHLGLGRAAVAAGDLATAMAALETYAANNAEADTPELAAALLYWNRALIGNELGDWVATAPRETPATVDHSAQVETNLAALTSITGVVATEVEALSDAFAYLRARRSWCTGETVAGWNSRLVAAAARWHSIAPESARPARLVAAHALVGSDGNEALAWAQAVADATIQSDADLYEQAVLTVARLHGRLNDFTTARSTVEPLLQRNLTAAREAEVRLFVGITHARSAQLPDAESAFSAVAADGRFSAEVRAQAGIQLANVKLAQGARDEALAALAAAAALPNARNALLAQARHSALAPELN